MTGVVFGLVISAITNFLEIIEHACLLNTACNIYTMLCRRLLPPSIEISDRREFLLMGTPPPDSFDKLPSTQYWVFARFAAMLIHMMCAYPVRWFQEPEPNKVPAAAWHA